MHQSCIRDIEMTDGITWLCSKHQPSFWKLHFVWKLWKSFKQPIRGQSKLFQPKYRLIGRHSFYLVRTPPILGRRPLLASYPYAFSFMLHRGISYIRLIIIIIVLIIHMKKLLDSDWLRAVQFKCNTSAKSVTPVQITHRNSGLWFVERHWESCRPMISCKRQWPKFCTETLKKFFSNAKKRASRNIFFHANFSCLYY